MEYSNPKIPEEINYSKENPLKEFLILAVGILVVVGACAISIHLLAQRFAQYIPFKYEAAMAPEQLLKKSFDLSNDSPQYLYIDKLAHKLAQHMDLPQDITLQVYYSSQSDINAFASLNGIIIITQGLLDAVQSENELAFVIAHEIAHIQARHPITSLSSSLIIGISVAIIGGSINNDSAAKALITGSSLSTLNFSRAQESQADALALNALHAYYGHTLGSTHFFKRLKEQDHTPELLTFMSTHPGHEARIEHMQQRENTLPHPLNATLTPLPQFE